MVSVIPSGSDTGSGVEGRLGIVMTSLRPTNDDEFVYSTIAKKDSLFPSVLGESVGWIGRRTWLIVAGKYVEGTVTMDTMNSKIERSCAFGFKLMTVQYFYVNSQQQHSRGSRRNHSPRQQSKYTDNHTE